MRNWQSVSPRQRVLDAVAAYLWLSRKPYVKNDKIGLIGWSWGGASALFAQKLARRLSLPNGGFKATIAFYPNLKYAMDTLQWTRSGPIEKPTLILYGTSDTLESKEAYDSLLSAGYSADIRVLGFKGAYKKFDELGGYREKYHPSVGNFPKAFQKEAFETSIKEIKKIFVSESEIKAKFCHDLLVDAETFQVVVYESVVDEDKLAKYAALAGPAMMAAGGRILARGMPVAVKETGEAARTVVIEWDSCLDRQ